MASLSRALSGSSVGPVGPRPERLLELYDFEGCPFCRKVREALSILDLDAVVYPCPKNGPRYRPEVVRRGGKAQFPYLVDPNTGSEMYESDEIVAYLFERYGDGPVPFLLRSGLLNDLSSFTANTWRLAQGAYYQPAQEPSEKLELYSYEESPFCRLVREKLSSLELAYHLHNVARGSVKRTGFQKRAGKMMVPYLIDLNRDVAMFESAEIIDHLTKSYARRRRA
jgi:glutathione S-transferase